MKKVLVVDDSKTILNKVKVELEKYDGIEPVFAKSYQEAMEVMQQSDIQAAILDYNLPDAPEGEVIALADSYQIPTVILTGTVNKNVQNMILKCSVVDYIVKDGLSSIAAAVNAINRALKNYGKTVLIVDDSALYRHTLKESLERIHLNVIEAKDGQEALDIINSHQYTIPLLITDNIMPKLNGIDLTFKLRETYSKAELGIIATGSTEDEDTIAKFLKFGANDFMHKPFSHPEVATTINSNLEILDLFEQIKDMANKDFLTGSYNRRYFFESGSAMFSKARRKDAPLAVAMLDIDKFKSINDTYGHDVGDVAIKEVKKILDQNLRHSDLMARFGGEEFCILLEEISYDNVQRLFEKIRKSFEHNVIETKGTQLSYTVSIGVQYGLVDSLEEMVRLSDVALYEAKENGRNQVKVFEGES